MMRKSVALATLSAVAFVLLTPAALPATGDLPLPKWPQKFALAVGQSTSFGFPITRAGNVVVKLHWTGAPLNVSLTDVEDTVKVPAAKYSPPDARITFAVSAADVPKDGALFITVAAPLAMPSGLRTAPPPVATGTIAVTAPHPDLAVLQPKLKALVQRRQDAIDAARRNPPRPHNPPPQSLAAFNIARENHIAEMTKSLLAQLNTRAAAATAVLHTVALAVTRNATRSVGTRNLVWAPVVRNAAKLPPGTIKPPKITLEPGVKYDKPTILTVTPAHGSPGDEVIIKAGGLAPDPAQTAVLFTLQPATGAAAALVAPSAIISLTPAGDEVNITVAVPSASGTLIDYSDGSLVLKDAGGATSTPAKFHFVPILIPTISKVRPAGQFSAPGDPLIIEGGNFMPGSQACFKFPSAPQTAVSAGASTAAAASATLLPVTIPTYSADSSFVATVFVRYHYKTKYLEADIYGPDFPVTLDATVPSLDVITSLVPPPPGSSSRQGRPGEPLILSGKGFRGVPGQIRFGVDLKTVATNIIKWTDTQILVTVPDMDGFAQPYSCPVQVTLPNGAATGQLNFMLQPQIVRQYIPMSTDLSAGNVIFSKQTDNDRWYFLNDGDGVGATHHNSFWTSNHGSDSYFFTSSLPGYNLPRLRNGWTIVALEMDGFTQALISSFSNGNNPEGTDNPFVQVDWSIHAFIPFDDEVRYTVRLRIEGPKGVPYM
jgi:hypothetical protein